jgi:hypothetical protein
MSVGVGADYWINTSVILEWLAEVINYTSILIFIVVIITFHAFAEKIVKNAPVQFSMSVCVQQHQFHRNIFS